MSSPHRTLIAKVIGVVLAAAVGATGAQARCRAESGPVTNTVVELYTSEGCDSCPPADRWLAGLQGGEAIVPLAFHVDYWDYLGWRDPYASAAYTRRQNDRLRSSGARFLYTPQVILDGRDFPNWRARPSPRDLVGRTAAAADLSLEAEAAGDGELRYRITARLRKPLAAGEVAVAYLALYESGLVSQVKAGENRGARLSHDHVVREWRGPLAFDRDGRLDLEQTWRRSDIVVARAGIAAIVETANGRILQALRLPLCP